MQTIHLDNSVVLSAAQDHVACASQHFGMWSIEPLWFGRAVAAVNSGTWPMEPVAATGSDMKVTSSRDSLYQMIGSDIALVRMIGQMQKGSSSFGGVSTIEKRRAIRSAVADSHVKGILLAIDSPGGTAAGTQELADDVAAANKEKPVHAFIEDMGASAAYWVASQAGRVTANRAAQVGSIGTVAVVEDYSEAAAQQGIKVHVISTGDYKGMGVPGSEITEQHLEHVQEIVNEFAAQFYEGVRRGRGVTAKKVESWADGRVWIGQKAQDIGLIDKVETFEQAVTELRKEVRTATKTRATRSRVANYAVNQRSLHSAESHEEAPQARQRRDAAVARIGQAVTKSGG